MESVVSFDYSITSPAMTICSNGKFECYFITDRKKCQPKSAQGDFKFTGSMYPIWRNSQDRYERLSSIFIEELRRRSLLNPDTTFLIEDYAYGAKGRVFHLAENTEVIKYRIWKETGVEVGVVPPKSIKKLFTGNGNANKEQMAEEFVKRFGFSVHDTIEPGSGFGTGAANDIVDSVAIALIGLDINNGRFQLEDLWKKKVKKSRAKRETPRKAGWVS